LNRRDIRDQFEELWPATAGCRLTKTRYDVHLENTRLRSMFIAAETKAVVAEVEFRDERECRLFQTAGVVCGGSEAGNRVTATCGCAGVKTMSYQLRRNQTLGDNLRRICQKQVEARWKSSEARGSERYARARDAKTSEKKRARFADGLG